MRVSVIAALALSCLPSAASSSPIVKKLTFHLDGICSGPKTRTANLHLGADYSKGLIVNMHGWTDTAEGEVETSGDQVFSLKSGKACTFSDLALDKGFMVVYPQGEDNAWNAGPGCCAPEGSKTDDTCFIKHVVETVRASYAAENVFAMGFSNGGCMSWRLACELPPGYLTAMAPMHGVMGGSTHECGVDASDINSTVQEPGFACADNRAIPTLAWTGDADSIQSWIEVYASADRLRAMYAKKLEGYPQQAEVTLLHRNSDNERYLECSSTATTKGEGNITVCMRRDPTVWFPCSPLSCAFHRYPDDADSCTEDSHCTSLVLDFFLSQLEVKQTHAALV